uniref:Ig-like domain-containing protein n=1 Tax=Biomphalaria glabrata TaxID=6526 RepID=A0A2C9KC66_BIOGL
MTYEWTVNGIKSSVTDKFYSLLSVSSANNGDYVCKAKYKSLTSEDSDPKTVTVTAPGIPCYEDSFCLFPYGGYTGKCDETERCECSDGYSKRGNLCSGSPGVEGATCTTVTTCQATDFTLSTCTGGTCGCLNSSFVAIRSGCACSPGVEGATCTTVTTCQATDFTLSTCTGGTCGCLNSSFVAIRSGCALQLEKPVITPIAGRTNQVIDGQPFTLTCAVSGAATYEWYKGSTNLATATSTYTATASSTTVGSFTCKGIGSDTVFTSPMSDAFTVVLLGASSTSAVQPVLTLSVTTPVLASSNAITLSCTNIPMGYSDTITYKVNAVAITSTVTIDSSNAGKDASCELTTPSSTVTFSSPTSAAVKLPTLVTNIQTVTVTAASQTVTEVLAGPSVTLTCSHIPAVGYLGGPTVNPTYAWQKDGSTITSETGDTLSVSASGSYSCTAQLASQTTVSSTNKVKVTIANQHPCGQWSHAPSQSHRTSSISSKTSRIFECVSELPAEVEDVFYCLAFRVTVSTSGIVVLSDPSKEAPIGKYSNILDASANRPIKGGRVILTCGDIRTDNPIYTWTKDTTVISRQLDRKLHLDNVDSTTDDGAYTCTAVGNQFYLSSKPVTLAVQ